MIAQNFRFVCVPRRPPCAYKSQCGHTADSSSIQELQLGQCVFESVYSTQREQQLRDSYHNAVNILQRAVLRVVFREHINQLEAKREREASGGENSGGQRDQVSADRDSQ